MTKSRDRHARRGNAPCGIADRRREGDASAIAHLSPENRSGFAGWVEAANNLGPAFDVPPLMSCPRAALSGCSRIEASGAKQTGVSPGKPVVSRVAGARSDGIWRRRGAARHIDSLGIDIETDSAFKASATWLSSRQTLQQIGGTVIAFSCMRGRSSIPLRKSRASMSCARCSDRRIGVRQGRRSRGLRGLSGRWWSRRSTF